MGKLQDFQRKMCWDEGMFMCTDVPTDIFHYTSPSGFESILFRNPEKTELWASRYDCLNDSSEGTVAIERYKIVCESMLKGGELPSDIYNIIKDVKPPRTTLMWHHNGEMNVLTRPEYVRYVCSFSQNPDSLAMWNYYTKGSKYEGFNLGFYADALVQAIDLQLQPYESKVRMYPVVYDQHQQDQLIHDFICALVKNYEADDEDAVLRYMASNQLLQWSLVFKREYFKHEEEIRLIVDIGVRKYDAHQDIPQIPTYYRIVNGYTVPYIKLSFDKHCLSYATVGPLTCGDEHKKTQVDVLEERLSTGGYTAIGQHSNIPVRY